MFIADHKPYLAPDSLDDLKGPYEGIFILPHSVCWRNEEVRTFDETVDVEHRCASRDLISEGTDEQRRDFIDKELLIQDFPHFYLPEKIGHAKTAHNPFGVLHIKCCFTVM
ncbi:hypothetical protein OS128_12550 [Corynebacterium sp. P5848]|uniref:hypothetical protein n=1 Tax=Corynebacterium marambiense TaxID=2765364 RepID=UPI002260C8EF|nr:hypothetical protein [Corynebacterium marambiense]MCX7543734.1 hypothetical protein [Corynebacterium marambiense]